MNHPRRSALLGRACRIWSEAEIPWERNSGPDSSHAFKVLLDEPGGLLCLSLEQYDPGAVFRRTTLHNWEELFAIRGSWSGSGKEHGEAYFCLTGTKEWEGWTAGDAGCSLLRLSRKIPPGKTDLLSTNSVQPGQLVEPQLFEQLNWEEIPARKADDPGARVVQLSRNQAGTSITSLMDCRPRWVLDEHCHPSDVVTYCIRGGGLLTMEGRRFNFTEGQVVTIAVDTPHQFQTGLDGAFMLILVTEPLS